MKKKAPVKSVPTKPTLKALVATEPSAPDLRVKELQAQMDSVTQELVTIKKMAHDANLSDIEFRNAIKVS